MAIILKSSYQVAVALKSGQAVVALESSQVVALESSQAVALEFGQVVALKSGQVIALCLLLTGVFARIDRPSFLHL